MGGWRGGMFSGLSEPVAELVVVVVAVEEAVLFFSGERAVSSMLMSMLW